MATSDDSNDQTSSSVQPMTLEEAVQAGDTTAALMAVSSDATESDSKHNAIFQCIVQSFDEQGLNHINNEQAKIVWPDIEDDVIVKLGDGVTSCLSGKGVDVPELAGPFMNLKTGNKTTVVSDLVTAIEKFA